MVSEHKHKNATMETKVVALLIVYKIKALSAQVLSDRLQNVNPFVEIKLELPRNCAIMESI